MKMTKRLLSLLLAAITVLCMFTLTACGDTSWVAKYDDETVPAGIYPLAVMLAYENVYSTYGAFDLSTPIEFEDGTKTTIEKYLESSAKDSVKNYVATKALYEKLGLSYSDEDYDAYMAEYGSYYAAQSAIYKENGISKESFDELVIMNSLRLDALADYYAEQQANSASDLYVSDGDIEKYFNENYMRFNYMIYYAVDENGNYLTKESDAYKAELDYLNGITDKQLSEEEYAKIAEKYTNIDLYKEGGIMDAADKEALFADTSMGDVYAYIDSLEYGESGIYTLSLYDEYYRTCHVICAAQNLAPDQTGSDYLKSAEEIRETMCNDILYAELDALYAELGVKENSNVYDMFKASKMNFDDFTSIVPRA